MRRKQLEQKIKNLVGPKLKEARLKTGLSQEKVSEMLELDFGMKIDRSAIARLENQTRSVDDFEIFILAQIYHVDIGWLFSSQKPPEPKP